ncbi:MAG TPA: hypothetical protein VGS19_22820 [Streptosporangiaceae bacterium]|nr:hypothetical protein [Streptosporangiaceae bacterium]
MVPQVLVAAGATVPGGAHRRLRGEEAGHPVEEAHRRLAGLRAGHAEPDRVTAVHGHRFAGQGDHDHRVAGVHGHPPCARPHVVDLL